MLETIGEFASERLRESGEEGEIQGRHAEYFLALAETADLSVEGQMAGRGDQGYPIVLPEQSNLRAALDWLVATDEIERALREALQLLDESARLAGEIRFVWWQGGALANAAEVALEAGRLADARPRMREALTLAGSIHDRQGVIYALALCAWLQAGTGRPDLAGRLWGAIEAEAARARIGQWENEREQYAARIVVDDAEFAHAAAQGRAMTLDEAIQAAWGDID